MEGEQPSIAETEQAQPAIAPEQEVETEETETEKPRDLQQPDEGQAGEREESEDDGLDELDFGFNKFRVPKELKTAVEEWRAATTKKEQTVAEQRRALEADRLKQAEASEAELTARAELHSVKAQIAEFAGLSPQDWAYHMQNDPLGTQQARLQYDMLKERQAELEGTVTSAAKERTELAQQDLAKRAQETLEAAPKIIPGWKAETANDTIKELVTFAQSEGIPDQVLQDNWSPQLLKLLHRAHLGHNLLTKQATAPKPVVVPPQPLQTVGGKSSPMNRTDLASADMETYVALRKKGVGGKGR